VSVIRRFLERGPIVPVSSDLRTTNVIESSFATIRHRTVRSKGCLSNKTAHAMIFKLAEAAESSRQLRRLQISGVIPGGEGDGM
jgi:transposase-like protein